MKWHEWALLVFLMLPTIFFVACVIFSMCEPYASVFSRKRGMSGG